MPSSVRFVQVGLVLACVGASRNDQSNADDDDDTVLLQLKKTALTHGKTASHHWSKMMEDVTGSNTYQMLTKQNNSARVKAVGMCCGDIANRVASEDYASLLPMALVFGDENGQCCSVEAGFTTSQPVSFYSASKWITGALMAKLSDEGVLSEGLDTKAADVFDWWDADDERGDVTVGSLVSFVDGLTDFNFAGDTMGFCFEAGGLEDCARIQYDHAVVNKAAVGTRYRYTEASFISAGAVAVKAAGAASFGELYRQKIADPLGMSAECDFAAPASAAFQDADPGSSLQCSAEDYGKFLHALVGNEFLSSEMRAAMESPLTLNSDLNCQYKYFDRANIPCVQYGLGYWLECVDSTCTGGARRESVGAALTYPWISRGSSLWGIAVRDEPTLMGALMGDPDETAVWEEQLAKMVNVVVPEVESAYAS